uniref:Uncharacterized protein n=1 Tax=Caenorhabditis japonica TaxID=281687 RepID=A0A8R1E0A1_CAEJA
MNGFSPFIELKRGGVNKISDWWINGNRVIRNGPTVLLARVHGWRGGARRQAVRVCVDVSGERVETQDSICLTYVYNLLPVDLEIISWSPALIIYRNLLTARQKNDFLDYIKQTEMIHQKTSDYGVTRETTQRRANGSFIQHGETPVTAEIHRKLQQRIPALNFESAESFSETLTNHGGCPIHSGRKVISTLWIRAKHQPLIPMLSPEEPIRADWMIPGLTEQFKSGLRTECPAN